MSLRMIHLPVVAFAVVLGAGACSADGALEPDTVASEAGRGAAIQSEPAPDRRSARVEINYMTFTMDHHASGIAMAEVCLEKAVHEELLELCRMSIESQTQQNAQLRVWLQEWYGIDHEPTIKPEDQAKIDALASLPDGEPFENAFLDAFSRHHAIIVVISTRVLPELYHEPLREMARMTIEMQTEDIQKMQAWDCEWFGDCRTPVPTT